MVMFSSPGPSMVIAAPPSASLPQNKLSATRTRLLLVILNAPAPGCIQHPFTVNPVTQETRSLKIWGSPISPSFGEGWAFNRKRDKLYNLWQTIPEDTDIVITHGPPKGVLDLAYNGAGELEFCGCNALKNRILEIQPLILMYGHIHDNDNIINAGYTKLSEYKTIFSNGSIVRDGDFNGRLNPGNIFEI